MEPQKIKTILFDYDGTLHDSLHIYAPAFRKAFKHLVDNYGVDNKSWTDKEISKFLGQTPREMWDAFGTDISKEAKSEASQIIGEAMEQLIKNGEAKLYDGAIETLYDLKKKGYTLVFISNCKNYYLHAHTNLFKLGKYFEHMVCSESYPGIEAKEKVLEKLKPQLAEEMVIVGDRHHDMKAGSYNNIHTIGATYGFGDVEELKESDLTIDNIKELQDIL